MNSEKVKDKLGRKSYTERAKRQEQEEMITYL